MLDTLDILDFKIVNPNIKSNNNLSKPKSKLSTYNLKTGDRLSKPELSHKEEKPPISLEIEV